ncbi:DUF4276 family protein [Pyxidicoccus xibeiensis]|uniref:DUF4276 family protein n=1 Tax=Pyxidicoccus xibeiensis TaxID=2906759 RepID=UPI0020A71DAD|nr:DUF4276 family protein [Pyxidicoccus xibeiensis]MCP3140606.1 DUF4276 family protein [Pyxidicoccus xibeiensis]
MIRVNLVTEDRTGGGLSEVVQTCVQALRAQAGRERLWFPPQRATVDGAAQLLKECEKYELYRFNYAPRFHHVFFVLDARNVWRLPQLGVQAPEPPLERSLPKLIEGVKAGMELIARGRKPSEEWARSSEGFHPHVLVWERESLILPACDVLGLGEPVKDVYSVRQAAEAVSERLRANEKRKYDKAIHGPRLLGQIARNADLRAVVLASNPSLKSLVDEMVSL